MVAFNNPPAEEIADKIKESFNKRHFVIGAVAAIIIVGFFLAVIVGVTFVITWPLAYLWNIGIVPFGVPILTWWQVTAIWILLGVFGQIIKKIFRD